MLLENFRKCVKLVNFSPLKNKIFSYFSFSLKKGWRINLFTPYLLKEYIINAPLVIS